MFASWRLTRASSPRHRRKPRSGALASGAIEAFRPPYPRRPVSHDIAHVAAEVQSAKAQPGEYSLQRASKTRLRLTPQTLSFDSTSAGRVGTGLSAPGRGIATA